MQRQWSNFLILIYRSVNLKARKRKCIAIVKPQWQLFFQYYNSLAIINWVQNANLADDVWYPETAEGVLENEITSFFGKVCRYRAALSTTGFDCWISAVSSRFHSSQWRGNYFRTRGARPRAPKSGTWNNVFRWKWSVFYSKNKRSLKKKGSSPEVFFYP